MLYNYTIYHYIHNQVLTSKEKMSLYIGEFKDKETVGYCFNVSVFYDITDDRIVYITKRANEIHHCFDMKSIFDKLNVCYMMVSLKDLYLSNDIDTEKNEFIYIDDTNKDRIIETYCNFKRCTEQQLYSQFNLKNCDELDEALLKIIRNKIKNCKIMKQEINDFTNKVTTSDASVSTEQLNDLYREISIDASNGVSAITSSENSIIDDAHIDYVGELIIPDIMIDVIDKKIKNLQKYVCTTFEELLQEIQSLYFQKDRSTFYVYSHIKSAYDNIKWYCKRTSKKYDEKHEMKTKTLRSLLEFVNSLPDKKHNNRTLLDNDNILEETIKFHKKYDLKTDDFLETVTMMLEKDYILSEKFVYAKMNLEDTNMYFKSIITPKSMNKNDLKKLLFNVGF